MISWRLQAPLPPLPDVPEVLLSAPGEAVAWLKAEFDNVVAAIRACADHGPLHWCWNLAIGVILDMTRHGRGRDVLPLVEVVAEAARRSGEPQAIVLALGEVGRLWSASGRPVPDELITEMLTAAEASASAVMAGHAQYITGVVHLRSNNQAEAIGYLRRARDTQERADDAAGLALTLQQLGNVHYDHGDLRAALAAYERMVEIGGDTLPSLTAAGLMSVCLIRITIGEVDGARRPQRSSPASGRWPSIRKPVHSSAPHAPTTCSAKRCPPKRISTRHYDVSPRSARTRPPTYAAHSGRPADGASPLSVHLLRMSP
ncbi:tetratricopeptide repeat protein [Kribbella sp. C-35]|uniref:tetratricopeptide repeat protein n=1 Tax=Kribbella sp. C-35 TaxID=2789276 RepID=UPI00397D9C11